jgi:hypothetical protein
MDLKKLIFAQTRLPGYTCMSPIQYAPWDRRAHGVEHKIKRHYSLLCTWKHYMIVRYEKQYNSRSNLHMYNQHCLFYILSEAICICIINIACFTSSAPSKKRSTPWDQIMEKHKAFKGMCRKDGASDTFNVIRQQNDGQLKICKALSIMKRCCMQIMQLWRAHIMATIL